MANTPWAYANNQAIEYETDANPPILTYQRFRGQCSLFIEWRQPLFTRPAPASARHAQNPFQEYCDNNRDALVDYARELHSYISKERVLTDYQRREVDEIRTVVTREWQPDHDTPEALIENVGMRSHRDLLIELAVTHEKPGRSQQPRPQVPRPAALQRRLQPAGTVGKQGSAVLRPGRQHQAGAAEKRLSIWFQPRCDAGGNRQGT